MLQNERSAVDLNFRDICDKRALGLSFLRGLPAPDDFAPPGLERLTRRVSQVLEGDAVGHQSIVNYRI